MFETVSVDAALRHGKRTVSYPALCIMIILMMGGIAAGSLLNSGWLIGGAVVLSFALAWLYWTIAVTKWRLWAFENVRNVHELKKRAIKEQLIWKDGSFFEKTELRFANDKQQWEALQSKFKLEDVFNDDYTVSPETIIYYSKAKAIGQMLICLPLMGGGVYLYFKDRELLLPIILFAAGIFLLVLGYCHLSNRNSQLALSNEGITAAGDSFFSWGDIDDEDTVVEKRGKSSTTYLTYNCPDGTRKIEIGELDISKSTIEKLLRIYRGRYQQKANHR